ncbi:MAG TPA: hypothetical protein DIT64_07685 [Verrucomicrobiales bacterium]|nr:hypothetical protein [Verrucomicrobiales bacterium]
MHLLRSILLIILVSTTVHALAPDESEARLRMARQIAREKNDRELVQRVEKLARKFNAGLPAESEQQLREAEKAVGIDPGGWSMAGQPLFHPTAEMEAALKAEGPKLAAAMASGDAKAVREITRAMEGILGDQAGVPDGRRMGQKPSELKLSRAEVVKLLLAALETEGRAMRTLMKGELLPDQMVRVYAYMLDACVTMHPHVAQHVPERVADVEKLLRGTASVLLRLQQPQGHFPFPDLRGKNIRFGDMTTKHLQNGTIEIQDGWIITPDPDGGSQFDTGVCGVALLRAGEFLKEEGYLAAGRRAAEWAAKQKCCANFNYNAFSVSLLARAGMKEAALEKFRVGVAPGQAKNGRWLDAHNARTVYHVIILRALADLGRSAEVDAVALPAIHALLDEFDAMGITVEALPELHALAKQHPDEARLQKAVRDMASTIVNKCTDGTRVKLGAQPHQLAAVVEVVE